MKKYNLKFTFVHFMILKTITLLCFIFSLLILLAPFIVFQNDGFTKNIFFYFYKLSEFLTQKYFITIPLFIGTFLFIYLFLMKKLKKLKNSRCHFQQTLIINHPNIKKIKICFVLYILLESNAQKVFQVGVSSFCILLSHISHY